MNYKDRVLLEQAYQTILEAGMPPAEEEAPQEEGQEPTPEQPEATDPLDDPQMQEAMAILNQYAQGDINNVEAANMFKDLYQKGAGQGPTQDDMYKTTTDSELPKTNSGGLRPAVPRTPGVR
jgi:hypothetical protein